ncbi:MAG TPA: hypothetical protein VD927_10280 [Chryseosolibacter sp.]|nr:hypothetical protein [Chryseosolibacter sp.]
MKHFLSALIVFATTLAYSQGEDNSLKGVPFKERIVTGGGFGLGFGSNADFISVSPQVGYMLTQKIMAGTGFTYRYTNYKFVKPSIKLNDYSINPFARYNVYENFFLQAEYEYLNFELPVSLNETTREDFNSFLAGGGIIQPLGDRVSLFIMALYNFSYVTPKAGEYAPYDSPIVFRIGVNAGGFSF